MHSFKTAFAPALIGLMLAASCNTAEPEQRDLISLTESSLSQNEAMSQFASILSKAAADNEDLRAFIFGIGGNNGNTSDHEVTVSIRRTEKSDDLGSESLEFEKRIIQREDQKTINGVLRTGYEVNPVSFGSLSVTLLPVNIR